MAEILPMSFGPQIKFFADVSTFAKWGKGKGEDILHVEFGPSIHENKFPEEHWILISGFVFVKMLL